MRDLAPCAHELLLGQELRLLARSRPVASAGDLRWGASLWKEVLAQTEFLAADLALDEGNTAGKAIAATVVKGSVVVSGLPVAVAILRATGGAVGRGFRGRIVGARLKPWLEADSAGALEGFRVVHSLRVAGIRQNVAGATDGFVLAARVAKQRYAGEQQDADKRESQQSRSYFVGFGTQILAHQRTPSVRLGREHFQVRLGAKDGHLSEAKHHVNRESRFCAPRSSHRFASRIRDVRQRGGGWFSLDTADRPA